MRRPLIGVLVTSFFLAAGCDDSSSDSGKSPPGKKAKPKPAKSGDDGKSGKAPRPEDVAPAAAWAWDVPKGLGEPPLVPEDNPMSKEKVELGHKLFMDKRLSVDGTRSCYSCHQNHHGNADGRARALGPGNKDLPRNSPTIWNVGYLPAYYWDGRAPTLEKQGLGALKGGNMGLGDKLPDKAAEMGALPEYKDAFTKVFGLEEGDKVTPEHVTMALSAYERTLLCGGTAFDTQVGLSEEATRGQKLFMGKGTCVTCHNGPNFTDGLFHVTGVAVDPKAKDADVGRSKPSKNEADKFKFRTPTLRNVSKTGPYFHDGSVADLKEAVATMAAGGKPQGGLVIDELLKDRKLTPAEVDDVVAFLKILECPGELEEIGDQTADGIAPPS